MWRLSTEPPPAANIMEPKSDHQTGTAGCKYTARTHKYKLKKNTSISPSENHPSVSNKHVLLKISFPHRQGRWDQINTNGVTGTKGLLPPFLASLTIGVVAWFPMRPRNVMCRPRVSDMCRRHPSQISATTLSRWHSRFAGYTKCQLLNLISRDNCLPWQISWENS